MENQEPIKKMDKESISDKRHPVTNRELIIIATAMLSFGMYFARQEGTVSGLRQEMNARFEKYDMRIDQTEKSNLNTSLKIDKMYDMLEVMKSDITDLKIQGEYKKTKTSQ